MRNYCRQLASDVTMQAIPKSKDADIILVDYFGFTDTLHIFFIQSISVFSHDDKMWFYSLLTVICDFSKPKLNFQNVEIVGGNQTQNLSSLV